MAKVKVGKKSAGSNKRNLIILGVLGGLIVVVGVVVFLVTKTESKPITPAGSPADAQVDRDQPVSTDRPSRPRASSVKRNSAPSEAPATEVTKDIPVPVVPAEMKALTGTVGEYFSRYERAVAGGESWSALSQWAEQAGLYVEAYHCARLAGSTMGLLARSPKTHATNVLVTDEQDRWKLVSQDTFEETLAVKPKLPSWFDPQQLVHQLGQLGPEQGSANQSRVASLLVQVDCPAGRKLYTQMINQPNFYPILVRATSHSYFDGDPNERQWARSWYQTPPMNLWLIRQLIAYSPPEQTKEKKETLVAGPEGLNRPNDKERQLSPSLAHKLLLLQILARRGGIVSAALIGELLDADEKDDVGRGLVSGSVPIELFSRFAGSYAEPLVEPMGKILSQHSSNANEWGPVSQVMGRFFHDQAASVVFTLAEQKRMPIGGQTALSLAAGGGRYVLTRLLQLAHAGKLTDFDVVSVFLLWTKSENVEGKTFWDWMGSFVSPAALDQNGRGADDTAPGRRGIETPRFEDMPGEPEHATGRRVRHRQQRAEAPAARSGWPAQRRFTGLVDSNAAKEFLVGLAGLPAPKMTSEAKSRAPARPSPARRGPPVQRDSDASGTALQDNRQLKEDAVRVMATLGDTGLRQFYRTLIGDPCAGPFAQLA